MAFDLTLEYTLSGKPARVMQLLSDPELIRKWSGEEAILENKVGGRFEMFDGWSKKKWTATNQAGLISFLTRWKILF